ncbi:MAG: carboxypeptidase-like regulatory domain-containing protein, partial [Micromonosporaceae bacterium]
MTGRAKDRKVPHSRPRLARAGAALLTALGMIVVTVAAAAVGASPAYAQGPADLTIAASGNPNLSVGGGAQRVVFTVSNAGPGDARNVTVRIVVPLAEQGVKIEHGPDGCRVNGNNLVCRIDEVRRGGSEQIPIQIAPPGSGGPAPGQSQQGQGQAQVGYGSDIDPNNNSAGFTVTLNGPDRPDNIPSVTGTVTDNKTTKPVANAKVTLTDEKGTKRKTATNKNGQYKISSTESKTIAPGTLKITVTKDGYDKKDITKTGNPGESVKADALMIPKVKPSATKSPTAKDTKTPTDSGEDEGTSWFVWLLYVFAALLVIGGIALIVWLMKGRNEDEDEDGYDDSPRRHGPAPIGARGGYGGDPYGAPTTAMGGTQPTTVLGGEAPTSMINRPGMDQPTSM